MPIASVGHAEDYPDVETFRKQVRDGGLVTQSLSYTLSQAVPTGSGVRPQSIASARFLSD